MVVVAPQMAKKKDDRPKRTYLAAKISARTIQLARIASAYQDGADIQVILSDICEPALLRRLKDLGAPIPPDPDDGK